MWVLIMCWVHRNLPNGICFKDAGSWVETPTEPKPSRSFTLEMFKSSSLPIKFLVHPFSNLDAVQEAMGYWSWSNPIWGKPLLVPYVFPFGRPVLVHVFWGCLMAYLHISYHLGIRTAGRRTWGPICLGDWKFLGNMGCFKKYIDPPENVHDCHRWN